MEFWIDSHCHMNDDVFKDEFETYYQKAVDNNVLLSNLICLNKQDYLRSKEIKKLHPSFDISVGFFPTDYDKVSEEDFVWLEDVMKNDKDVIALGEIGLDYHWDDNKERQQELFVRQIELANKYNKPIMIHSRESSNDTYQLLKQHAKVNVLLHCYSQSQEMMERYLKLGYYISFSGVVTFSSAKETKICAQNCPLDRIVTETDSPYLTPVPYRGKQNETSYVKYVGEYIANLKGIDNQTLQKCVYENYNRLLGRVNEKD